MRSFLALLLLLCVALLPHQIVSHPIHLHVHLSGTVSHATQARELEAKAYAAFIQSRAPNMQRTTAIKIARVVQATAREDHVDPTLLLAIMETESNFRVKVRNACCYGLMQVALVVHRGLVRQTLVNYHSKSLYDPAVNIRVGAVILKHAMRTTHSIQQALLRYNGALEWNSYPSKVLWRRRAARRFVSWYRREHQTVT